MITARARLEGVATKFTAICDIMYRPAQIVLDEPLLRQHTAHRFAGLISVQMPSAAMHPVLFVISLQQISAAAIMLLSSVRI